MSTSMAMKTRKTSRMERRWEGERPISFTSGVIEAPCWSMRVAVASPSTPCITLPALLLLARAESTILTSFHSSTGRRSPCTHVHAGAESSVFPGTLLPYTDRTHKLSVLPVLPPHRASPPSPTALVQAHPHRRRQRDPAPGATISHAAGRRHEPRWGMCSEGWRCKRWCRRSASNDIQARAGGDGGRRGRRTRQAVGDARHWHPGDLERGMTFSLLRAGAKCVEAGRW
ncbi:hypothetical protein DFH06DRAFT_170222 [Mycena polygramma]|nr:hypothetical protein DFH06DRAFT_170222 [Mycena polygramma]